MNAKALDAWRSRPMTTRTLDHCNECGKLREGVMERTNYWPYVVKTCCQPCFTGLVDDAKTGGQ
ncbi:hypothetical protein [Burkholderia pseudomallei]|uniref:hypothetical protein n=1 Tax=Burkholderia pseudomallei TaxID=28450 RepID=UPI00097548AF|nr:hypothetical protein [Burkholderia pseudomallei]OMQ57101.1 hypothetical protein AQ709_26750 [Burkholderia pseudomallei]CAJ2718281.1 Uncharacterised protein [Burkholderia pseudomallei]CAJ4668589.1 Uncharacterised protein [Burkholderia pseudomallei]VBM94899.1 Uncharacterised protein [Burkholderia pseudomallei]VBX79514.1 Uncharacterised protein [Burkholderia pseudomallei]